MGGTLGTEDATDLVVSRSSQDELNEAVARLDPNTRSKIGTGLKATKETTPEAALNHEPTTSFTVVLIRHGESTWNHENRFTGWTDVALTEEGKVEADEAGRLLQQRGFAFDYAFTSELARAYDTCDLVLEHTSKPETQSVRSWQLNERHYGGLQGLKKDDPNLFRKHGKEQVMAWRRSYDSRPPPIDDSNPTFQPPPAPLTESLQDCEARVAQYFHSDIAPCIRRGATVLIVAHANTLRALVKTIDDINDDDIKGLHIPNSIPLVYRLDENLLPVAESDDFGFQGEYLLGKEDAAVKIRAYERSERRVLAALFRALDEDQRGTIGTQQLLDGINSLCSDTSHVTQASLLNRHNLEMESELDLEAFVQITGPYFSHPDHFTFKNHKFKNTTKAVMATIRMRALLQDGDDSD